MSYEVPSVSSFDFGDTEYIEYANKKWQNIKIRIELNWIQDENDRLDIHIHSGI